MGRNVPDGVERNIIEGGGEERTRGGGVDGNVAYLMG